MNANAAAVAENENPAGVSSTNGVEDFELAQSLSSIERSEIAIASLQRHVIKLKGALALGLAYCDSCNSNVPPSGMMTDSLCDVCAAELDADYREFEDDRADVLYDLNH